jgi:sugar lactone lactonase YvrE
MSGAGTSATPAELALDARVELAEGPVWDDRRRVFWWVDIPGGRIHRFDPIAASDSAIEIGSTVGCVALTESGDLVVAAAGRLLELDPETGNRHEQVPFEPGTQPQRCNDGKCDPQGRFWVGRMAIDKSPGAGSLVRVDGSAVSVVVRGLTVPNGLDWSIDGSRMYFVDSPSRTISVFEWNAHRGVTGPAIVFWRTADVPELPPSAVADGLTVDSEDCLWVAIWGGGCVVRLAPDGTFLGRVEVPVSRVSSCSFGGDDLTELLITTAREDATVEELAAQPTAGGLYRARPGVRGRPPNRMTGPNPVRQTRPR